jgi:hypothetical protein
MTTKRLIAKIKLAPARFYLWCLRVLIGKTPVIANCEVNANNATSGVFISDTGKVNPIVELLGSRGLVINNCLITQSPTTQD